MAGTSKRTHPRPLSVTEPAGLITQEDWNDLVNDLETLRAGLDALAAAHNAALTKLDADAGVTDANYNALHAVVRTTYDTAGDMTAGKIADMTGTTL